MQELSLEEIGPIPQEEKVTTEEVEVPRKEELFFGVDWRIVNYEVKPQKVVSGGKITVSGTVQNRASWNPFDDWDPEHAQVALLINGVKQETTLADPSFAFDVTVPWEVGTTGVVRVSIPRISDYKTMPVTIRVVRADRNGGNGDTPPTSKPKSFLNYLKNFQFEKLWKYHKEKTLAAGIGATALVVAVSNGGGK